MKQTRPAVGWVRGTGVPDESAAQEILQLRKKVSELEPRLAMPPPGAEQLAHGDVTTSLRFAAHSGNCATQTKMSSLGIRS